MLLFIAKYPSCKKLKAYLSAKAETLSAIIPPPTPPITVANVLWFSMKPFNHWVALVIPRVIPFNAGKNRDVTDILTSCNALLKALKLPATVSFCCFAILEAVPL